MRNGFVRFEHLIYLFADHVGSERRKLPSRIRVFVSEIAFVMILDNHNLDTVEMLPHKTLDCMNSIVRIRFCHLFLETSTASSQDHLNSRVVATNLLNSRYDPMLRTHRHKQQSDNILLEEHYDFIRNIRLNLYKQNFHPRFAKQTPGGS